MVKRTGKVKKYQIYIGMSDKIKLSQLCSTKDFVDIVNKVCKKHKISFSMNEVYGAYINEKKELVTEKSLCISIMGFTKKQVFKLAEELRIKFNQNSVLISLESPEVFFIVDK